MRQFPTLQSLEEAIANGFRENKVPLIEQDGRLFARFELDAESGESSVTDVDIGKIAADVWEELS